jgi:hypothetical protein
MYPPLLSMIVAALVILAGVFLTTVGYRYRKMSRKFEDPFIDFFMKF